MNILNHYNIRLLIIFGLLVILSACKKDDIVDNPNIHDHGYRQIKMTPVSGLRVQWDYSSMYRLSDSGNYPRMIRTSDNSLVTVYDSNGSVYIIKSTDNGKSWTKPEILFKKSTHLGKDGDVNITYEDLKSQPSIIQLENGDMVAACAVHYRYILTTPDPDVIIQFPAAIHVKKIVNGAIVEPEKVVYSNLGCEHPDFLLLPDGKLQLYFTNSSIPVAIDKMNSTDLAVTTKELQIDVIESVDGGSSWNSSIKEFGPEGVDTRWTGSKTVVFRNQKNNIAPSTAIMKEQILLAFADNKVVTYKPYLVRSNINTTWPFSINGDMPGKDYARYEILPDKYLMTNPDLLTLSNDIALLSYQTDANRDNKSQTMEVVISDSDAKNFTKSSRPFPFSNEIEAINNSVMRFNENTIVALTSSNFHNMNERAPMAIKGYIINDLMIKDSKITNYPLFVGGISESNLRAGLGVDESNLYFEAEIVDSTPITAEKGTEKGDGVYIYVDAANLSLLDVDKGISKLWISIDGSVTRWDGKEGLWIPAGADGIMATSIATDSGYLLKVVIPKSKLTSFNEDGIRFAVGLSDYTDISIGSVELLSQCKDLRSSSWLGVTF